MSAPHSSRLALSRNALCAIAEYITQPLLLLCATPLLLRAIGANQYAIWLVATACISSGLLLSSAFGDAAIKFLSANRSMESPRDSAETILRTLLSLNLLFAFSCACFIFLSAPLIATHLPGLSAAQQTLCIRSLDIGVGLMLFKAAESVFICSMRAHENYMLTTIISVSARVLTVAAAVCTAFVTRSVVSILCVSIALASISLAAQAHAARRQLAISNLWPAWNISVVRRLFHFGAFSWIQSVVGILTQQADRVIVGIVLGAQALTCYGICVQATAPIHGIAAAGLQVLFPHLGARMDSHGLAQQRLSILAAFAANAAFVLGAALIFTFFGRWFLTHWLGAAFAARSALTLVLCAWSFALLGLNVTAYWTLMALGRVRYLALINCAASLVMIIAIPVLARRYGLPGAAAGRLLYGPVTWVSFRALRSLWKPAVHAEPSWRTCADS